MQSAVEAWGPWKITIEGGMYLPSWDMYYLWYGVYRIWDCVYFCIWRYKGKVTGDHILAGVSVA
jgi:hypothetical protein